MFIVVEGLDGVGKSTFVKALAKAIGADDLCSPADKFKNVRGTLEHAYEGNALARQLFYASTVVDISDEVRKLLVGENRVVVDRYWLSTQVYHDWKSEGKNFDLEDVRAHLLVPDWTIYLELPLEVRERRLALRGMNTTEDKITLNKEADDKLSGLYEKYSSSPIVGRWLTVDASLDVDSIVDVVRQHIGLGPDGVSDRRFG